MSQANVNPQMLTWARERSGFSLSEFAKRVFGNKRPGAEEKLLAWENGEQRPTFNQALDFAKKAYVPFGYLFLRNIPPQERLPIPDLRTVDGRGAPHPSATLIDLIKLMSARQEWYREYLQQELVEAPCQYIGRMTVDSDVSAIVADMNAALGIHGVPTRGAWEAYYRELIKKIESLGILVMRQGDLGHHTRKLDVNEFRGFAMVDAYAPLIFVNQADAPGAQLFTLIHELCHVWIGQSGISDGQANTHRKEETLCNAVAAEFLVPTAEFVGMWDPSVEDWTSNLPALEAHFRVSQWVLARRALTLGFIDQQAYVRFVERLKRSHHGAGSPSYYVTFKSHLSEGFARAVLNEALSGQMELREASHLLGGVKPNKLQRLAEEFKN